MRPAAAPPALPRSSAACCPAPPAHAPRAGNGYDKSWPAEADKRGLWQIKSGVEAIKRFTDPKNVALFSTHGVFTAEECAARQEVRAAAGHAKARL